MLRAPRSATSTVPSSARPRSPPGAVTPATGSPATATTPSSGRTPVASSTNATSSRCATPSSRHAPRRLQHVRATLGEQPERGAQRHRYDELAGDLEEWRLRHDVDVERDGPLGRPAAGRDRARETLVARVRESRQERGLPSDPPGIELEPETIELDLDL